MLILSCFDCLKRLPLESDHMFIAAPFEVEFVFQGWSVDMPQGVVQPRAQWHSPDESDKC